MGALTKLSNGFIVGYQKIGTAGTAVQLSTDGSSDMIKSLTIVASKDNSSQIVLGGAGIVASSGVTGFDAGEGITFEPINTPPFSIAGFYINGGASSDSVDIYAIHA